MIELYRLIQPDTSHRAHSAPKVHYQHPADSDTSLCRQVNVYRTVDGDKFRVWRTTKRPVTCKGCIVVLKGIVRDAVYAPPSLNGDQLEDLLQHIDTFRRGFGNGHNG